MIDAEGDANPSVPFNALHLLPPVSAVYIAENDREDILYIGSSRNLRQRWQNHHRFRCVRNAGCARIVWVDCPAEDLDLAEKRLIRHFRPPLNRNGMGKSKDPAYESTTIYMRTDIKRDVKRLLIDMDMELSDAVEEVMEEWLKKQLV